MEEYLGEIKAFCDSSVDYNRPVTAGRVRRGRRRGRFGCRRSHAYAGPNADACTYAYADADANACTNADADADADTYADANADPCRYHETGFRRRRHHREHARVNLR